MGPTDKMLCEPSDEPVSIYDALKETTLHWKKVGAGRADRMIQPLNEETAMHIVEVLYGDMYRYFETYLYEAQINPENFEEIREEIFQEVVCGGIYDTASMAIAIATILSTKFSSTDLAMIINNLEIVLCAFVADNPEVDFQTTNPSMSSMDDLPYLIGDILATYDE
jgi:hypothetical protein